MHIDRCGAPWSSEVSATSLVRSYERVKCKQLCFMGGLYPGIEYLVGGGCAVAAAVGGAVAR